MLPSLALGASWNEPLKAIQERHFMSGLDHYTVRRLRPDDAPGVANVVRHVYENTYVREDGVWKLLILNYRPVWHATFEDGWANTPPRFVPPFSRLYPDDPLGPDELIDPQPELWPATDVVPFHYPHPVTGKPVG